MQEVIKMKVIKIEIVENNNPKPEKYTFLGGKCGEQAIRLLTTKFNVSVVELVEKE